LSPPIRKTKMASSVKSIGVGKVRRPPHKVPSQLKDFDAGRHGDEQG
jgi:hypothetical protein